MPVPFSLALSAVPFVRTVVARSPGTPILEFGGRHVGCGLKDWSLANEAWIERVKRRGFRSRSKKKKVRLEDWGCDKRVFLDGTNGCSSVPGKCCVY